MGAQMNSNIEKKVKVGLVQINNSFANQTYFPYSIGLLQAYAQKHLRNIDDFEFLLPIYKRVPVQESLDNLLESDIAFFSTYVWNFNISLEIAKKIKEVKPGNINVFGGCSVPKKSIEGFLKENLFIDIACRGEGEKVFSSILENYKEKNWEKVPSISYISEENRVMNNLQGERIVDLNKIPSPYLEGVFDPLIEANPEQIWLGLWETNRGCPFACSFCEWGEEYHGKIYSHNLEQLFDEIDWFSQKEIEFVCCCDANFGILERDIELVNHVAENKEKYGYPKRLSVQNTKNVTKRVYELNELLEKTGLSKGVNIAFQSLNPETLENIGRKNISIKSFQDLQQRFNKENIETFSDIILGLPEETYESFTRGVSSLIKGGQHNRIQLINLSILPNSKMADSEYQKKYGFEIVESSATNNHGNLRDEEVHETQRIVVGTKTMPPEDWVKTRSFSWMTSLLYFDKLLQLPFTLLNREYSVDYRDLIESFVNTDSKKTPILSNINSFLTDKAIDMQKGGTEFCESKEWLNMWWPADELTFINLCTGGKLNQFYEEAKKTIEGTLKQKGVGFDPLVIDEAISLNRDLIKSPFQKTDLTVILKYNIWDVYKGALTGKPVPLERGNNRYLIDRTSESWQSWKEWCQKVVWYGHKKGDYMYSCTPLNINNQNKIKNQ